MKSNNHIPENMLFQLIWEKRKQKELKAEEGTTMQIELKFIAHCSPLLIGI